MERPARSVARHRPARLQHGVATLMVVMALVLVVSLAVAYAHRNLLFEQRTSVNHYRSMQALEVAEAGIEWALGMLNAGRVDAACQPTADAGAGTFRDRYLTARIAANAPQPRVTFEPIRWDAGGVPKGLAAACLRGDAGWACSCPTAGEPTLDSPAAEDAGPAFRVTFGAGGGPGTVVIEAVACTSPDGGCLAGQVASKGNARATASVLAALAPAMPTGPAAPVTVRGALSVGSHAWRVANADAATNGLTVNVGAAFDGPNAVLDSVPGSSGAESVIDHDASLSGLTAERLFVTLLGVDEATFRRLPSTLPFDCAAADCAPGLRDLVSANPGRPVWIPGDLRIGSDAVIGTPDAPVLLVVGGHVAIDAAGARIHGVLYGRSGDMEISGAGLIQGALVAAGNVGGHSAPAVVYDADAVARIRLTQGAIVRVPGGWRDF